MGRASLGLALSGGGLRGAAHVGVLQVLEEAGIHPDIITGTSVGSVVAGLYAAGVSPGEMEELAKNVRPRQVFDLVITPGLALLMLLKVILDSLHLPVSWLEDVPAGIADNLGLARIVKELTGGVGFDSLRIPCAIMATDISSGERVAFVGRKWLPRAVLRKPTVYITDVPVFEAVKASTAIPGVFLPVKISGRNLVDGGVTDYVPSEVARAMGARVVVAVSLGYAGQRPEPVDNILEVITQAVDIMGRELAELKLSHTADVVINPGIYDVGLLDFDRIPECIERGREAARLALSEIEGVLSRSGI